eukprot:snap_masked-scaffold_4-processed-gene-8.23-mRNA-1 protein AED:1.00 eAED:1.00 QI:0/0/0/0/1/1/2/0/83
MHMGQRNSEAASVWAREKLEKIKSAKVKVLRAKRQEGALDSEHTFNPRLISKRKSKFNLSLYLVLELVQVNMEVEFQHILKAT